MIITVAEYGSTNGMVLLIVTKSGDDDKCYYEMNSNDVDVMLSFS